MRASGLRSLGAGVDMWTILATIGARPEPPLSAQALAVVGASSRGAIALYGLQRLLGSEEEPSR